MLTTWQQLASQFTWKDHPTEKRLIGQSYIHPPDTKEGHLMSKEGHVHSPSMDTDCHGRTVHLSWFEYLIKSLAWIEVITKNCKISLTILPVEPTRSKARMISFAWSIATPWLDHANGLIKNVVPVGCGCSWYFQKQYIPILLAIYFFVWQIGSISSLLSM